MTHPRLSAAQQYRAALRANLGRYAWINLAYGLLLVLAGILAAAYSLILSSAVALTLAWVLIASAAMQLIILLLTKQLPYFSIQLISVASAIIVGLLLIREGQPGLSTLNNLVLVFLVVDNLSRLIFALAIRPYSGWWLIALSSVLGLGLATLLTTSLADASPPSIALIVAANFIATGAGICLLAWRSR
jgi:uncharacterized membrane protein HdeD (DUF308 family)